MPGKTPEQAQAEFGDMSFKEKKISGPSTRSKSDNDALVTAISNIFYNTRAQDPASAGAFGRQMASSPESDSYMAILKSRGNNGMAYDQNDPLVKALNSKLGDGSYTYKPQAKRAKRSEGIGKSSVSDFIDTLLPIRAAVESKGEKVKKVFK